MCQCIYDIVKWRDLLDHAADKFGRPHIGRSATPELTPTTLAWQVRLHTYLTTPWRSLFSDPTIPPEIRSSTPTYLYQQLTREYSDRCAWLVCCGFNSLPALYMRVNKMRASYEEVDKSLKHIGLQSAPTATSLVGALPETCIRVAAESSDPFPSPSQTLEHTHIFTQVKHSDAHTHALKSLIITTRKDVN